jgi:hypothetical protein
LAIFGNWIIICIDNWQLKKEMAVVGNGLANNFDNLTKIWQFDHDDN